MLVMSMMVSFCAVLFPRDVLDEILNLIESVSLRVFLPTLSNLSMSQHRKETCFCLCFIRFVFVVRSCFSGEPKQN